MPATAPGAPGPPPAPGPPAPGAPAPAPGAPAPGAPVPGPPAPGPPAPGAPRRTRSPRAGRGGSGAACAGSAGSRGPRARTRSPRAGRGGSGAACAGSTRSRSPRPAGSGAGRGLRDERRPDVHLIGGEGEDAPVRRVVGEALAARQADEEAAEPEAHARIHPGDPVGVPIVCLAPVGVGRAFGDDRDGRRDGVCEPESRDELVLDLSGPAAVVLVARAGECAERSVDGLAGAEGEAGAPLVGPEPFLALGRRRHPVSDHREGRPPPGGLVEEAIAHAEAQVVDAASVEVRLVRLVPRVRNLERELEPFRQPVSEGEEQRVLVEDALFLLTHGPLAQVPEPDRQLPSGQGIGAGHDEPGGAVDRNVRDGVGERLAPGELGEPALGRARPARGERQGRRRERDQGQGRDPEESHPPAMRCHAHRPPLVDHGRSASHGGPSPRGRRRPRCHVWTQHITGRAAQG